MDFETAVGKVFISEGGFISHPNDRGGATNYGITQRVYREWKSDPVANVKDLTKGEASQIYFEHYWEPSKTGQLPESLRYIHFDAAVNHGVARANKLLQAAAGVEQDGVIGNKTLDAVNSMDARLLKCRYVTARYKFYGSIIQRDRSQLVFMAGWMSRMKEFA